MLATGGSAVAAIDTVGSVLHNQARLSFAVLAAPEGVEVLRKAPRISTSTLSVRWKD